MRDVFEIYKNKTCSDLKRIPELSSYNHNYYFALNNSDLIYGISDDDNFTEYYYINLADMTKTYFAHSYTDEADILYLVD